MELESYNVDEIINVSPDISIIIVNPKLIKPTNVLDPNKLN